jgi:hypothetical protein
MKPGCSLPAPEVSFPVPLSEKDFVFSINILSQLPVIPVQYARKHSNCNEQSLDEWAASVIKSHLEWLWSLDAEVLLVTDVEHQAINQAGEVEQTFDLLYGNTVHGPISEWSWPYAPSGELVKGYALEAKVRGFYKNNR